MDSKDTKRKDQQHLAIRLIQLSRSPRKEDRNPLI